MGKCFSVKAILCHRIWVKSFSYSCARKVMVIELGLHETPKWSALRKKKGFGR